MPGSADVNGGGGGGTSVTVRLSLLKRNERPPAERFHNDGKWLLVKALVTTLALAHRPRGSKLECGRRAIGNGITDVSVTCRFESSNVA